jgi:hypothetical protein
MTSRRVAQEVVLPGACPVADAWESTAVTQALAFFSSL